MKKLEVEGKHELQGTLKIQGSKNAALPILSACVLSESENILHGCPKIQDVFSMIELLERAGARACWQGDALILDTSVMHPAPMREKAGAMRSSVMLLGSFLGRFGRVELGYPGGCNIGKRPIDLHQRALGALGVIFCEERTFFEARCKNLEGCDIYLPYSSVGVTENLLLAGVKAEGMTRIYGAAREPEIVELCRFLTAMGARIYGIGTERLIIMGGQKLQGAEYEIARDRIVAGTYFFAAAGAGGDILLKEVPVEHMRSTFQTLGRMGAVLGREGKNVRLRMKRRPVAIPMLATGAYPRFPTDLQSPAMSVLCTADGKSRIEERVFENRFLIAAELQKMGALVEIKDRTAYLFGNSCLHGAHLLAKDLRGGAALLIAAMEAEGNSVIENAEVIDRGYENITEDLKSLGVVIY